MALIQICTLDLLSRGEKNVLKMQLLWRFRRDSRKYSVIKTACGRDRGKEESRHVVFPPEAKLSNAVIKSSNFSLSWG